MGRKRLNITDEERHQRILASKRKYYYKIDPHKTQKHIEMEKRLDANAKPQSHHVHPQTTYSAPNDHQHFTQPLFQLFGLPRYGLSSNDLAYSNLLYNPQQFYVNPFMIYHPPMTMTTDQSTFSNANQMPINNIANNTDEDEYICNNLDKVVDYSANTKSKNKNKLSDSNPPVVHQPTTFSTSEVFPTHSTLSNNDAANARRLGVKSLHIKGWLQKLPYDVQKAIVSLYYDLCISPYNTKNGHQITIDAPYGENACDPTPSNHCRKVQRHYSGDDVGPVDANGNVQRPAYANGTGSHTIGIPPQ